MGLFEYLVVIVVVVGIAAAIVRRRKQAVDWTRLQMVVDTFDIAQAKAWFAGQTKENTRGKGLLVARMTRDMSKTLAVKAETMDTAHYLVVAVLDENNRVQTYQLVNFDRLENRLEELLDSNGGKVIIAY